ncbi:ladderlectin-like [Megalops cyprinoides]|uniref:ladderlectin-like n=1 Tax=Megalops cyprinoides TaxID=118141 RepID=UPI001864572A|nr:ladderlectin-like [Megalops cyprinoides]
MRVLTIAVLLCTALALPAATGETEKRVDDVASSQDSGIEKKYCITLGGNLASLHSLQEYEFVQKLTAGSPWTWVGGFDAVKEGEWQWSDGSAFPYHPWGVLFVCW